MSSGARFLIRDPQLKSGGANNINRLFYSWSECHEDTHNSVFPLKVSCLSRSRSGVVT
jgi:hypothetical protein